MSAAVKPRRGILAWLAGLDDGVIIRTAFFIMLAGCAAVLWIDYRELNAADTTLASTPNMPVLPAFDPDAPTPPNGPAVTSDQEALRQPLTIKLGSGGTLVVTGTIDIGAADRFKSELEGYREYIKTVALDSPGGSVNDALEMGKLIREAGFATSVASGALCASSCPLVFAGGKERLATAKSAIGVHQIYANVAADSLPAGLEAAGAAMSDAQKTTAAITRFLTETGVDPALWLHALETPPDRLYYLSPAELTEYRLATTLADERHKTGAKTP
jgi:hypothetical protein